MSAVEEPALTLIRLLKRYLLVTKEDGSVASVHISQEWLDRELLKNYDGQITVGLDRNEEDKLSFDGNLRKRLSLARVNVWSADKPDQGVTGRTMRDRIKADVLRVIREKRSTPNTTDQNYVGVGTASQIHKAYHAASVTELAPGDSGWTELTDAEYEKLWHSDDDRFVKSTLENGKYALMLFRFKLDADENVAKQIALSFEGYATGPSNGFIGKVWNHETSAWNTLGTVPDGGETILTVDLTSSLPSFIDADGYVWMLVRTLVASDGVTAAVLHCDYAETAFTVNGITYADVVGFRDADEVRVKPFLWRTEFTVKSWLFENVPVT